MGRDEEAALSGLLSVRLGGVDHQLPTLKIKQSRVWKAKVSEALGSAFSRIPSAAESSGDWLKPFVNLPSDVMLDLVVAYDVSKAIPGGRNWIESHADDREVWDALQEMLKATFPFVGALRSVVGASGDELRQMFVEYLRGALPRLQTTPRPPAPSTNGHSDTGDSIPTPLMSDSPTSST